MLEMHKHLYNLTACLFGGFVAGFKKASNLKENIGAINCSTNRQDVGSEAFLQTTDQIC